MARPEHIEEELWWAKDVWKDEAVDISYILDSVIQATIKVYLIPGGTARVCKRDDTKARDQLKSSVGISRVLTARKLLALSPGAVPPSTNF